MKNIKHIDTGPLFFILFFVTVVLMALLIKAFYIPTKTYHSQFLKITIDYPANYQLEEKFGTIILTNNEGEIKIGTNGTNYDSIDGYLEDLSKLNHLTITNKKKVKLKYEQATIVTINNLKKDYFFYPTDWSVYILSASSEKLYSDLDKIANSFHYNP